MERGRGRERVGRVQERTGDSRPSWGLRYSPDIEMSKPGHH